VSGKLVLIVIGGLAVVGLGLMAVAPDTGAPAGSDASPKAATRVPAMADEGPSRFGEGTYEVPADIAPGKYRTDGGDGCYWARLSSTDGSLDSIITNGNTSGPAVVTVKRSDAAFQVMGSCRFEQAAA
jgi:hypothetical protein